eukprot:264415_1
MYIALATLLLGVGYCSNPLAWMDEINRNFHNLDHHAAFKNWAAYFDKHYENAKEEEHRYLLFVENWSIINNHNIAGKANYTMGMNQFGDMTQTEFLYYVHGHAESCLKRRHDAVYPRQKTKENPLVKLEREKIVNAPTAIDWTNINGTTYVTPVKDQKNCGSCWAFSTVGSLESFAAIKNGWTGDQIVELREQQLVDCTYAIPDGCQGGLQEDGFSYIAKAGGLCTEKEYPYTGRDGSCVASSCGQKYDKISGYKSVSKNSETALVNALVEGPIAVSVDAAGPGWTYYKSGVYSAECSVSLDHGVVGVGYGHDSTGGDYWKIKNSWGTSWGMEGFMLICRNCNKNGNMGECGILRDNTYPTF